MCTLFTLTAFSYEKVKIEKSKFKTSDAGFNMAWQQIEIGNYWFNKGEIYFNIARKHYEKAYQYNQKNAALNYKIGVCHLYSSTKHNSLLYFKRAILYDEKVSEDIHYLLGRSYHLNHNPSKALKHYTIYKIKMLKKGNISEIRLIDKRMTEAKRMMDFMKKPKKVKIENLGETINSNFAEYCPLLLADESFIVFTARKENTTGNKKDFRDDDYFEDIYISQKTENGWQKTSNALNINTKHHDATVSLSPDGKSLLIYNNRKRRKNLYISHLKNEKWTKPKALKGAINSKYHEPSACISKDGNTIYFVSNRPGGHGKHDIYKAKKDEKGKWNKIENLGPAINTSQDEEGVFLHTDGKILYFSSKGHNTMGGYDIYKTVLDENNNWSKPVNLGYPINSPDDDVYFVVTANNEHAYYSSFKRGGLGEKDIYKIKFNPEYKQPDTMKVFDPLIVHEPAHPNVDIPDDAHITENKGDDKIEPDIHSIYFDYNKHYLRKESKETLTKLVKILKNNPEQQVVIYGHTDNTGTLGRNKVLSKQRANSTGQFLINNGIDEKRISYKALNYSKPVASNNTPQGRQLNRRVEFKIIN